MRRKPAKNRLPQISTRPVKTQTCTLPLFLCQDTFVYPAKFFPVKTQTCTSPPFFFVKTYLCTPGPSLLRRLSRHICVLFARFRFVKTHLCTFCTAPLCQDTFVYLRRFSPVFPVKTRLCTFCTAPLCQAAFAACIKVKQKVPLPHSHAIRAPCLVRKMGLEPTRHGHTHLKRACLPIPALPQIHWANQRCECYSSTDAGKMQGFCKKSFVEQVVGKDSAKKQPYTPKKQQRNGCNPAPFCYNGRWISHAAGGRIFPPGQEEYKTL